MYKFTIAYYYEKFTSGTFKNCVDKSKIRKAIVYAKSMQEAKEKLAQLDDSFIEIADNGLFAEEINSI